MLGTIQTRHWLFGLTLLVGAFLITTPKTSAQTAADNHLTQATIATSKPLSAIPVAPQFNQYRGVQMGMSAEDVRVKLNHLREKGKLQDFFVFSDSESAQVFYDSEGKVKAISIDYIGKGSNPPTSREVLGEDIQAKADGSMYELKRYSSAGYWVAYNRTAGNDPTVTITMQKDK